MLQSASVTMQDRPAGLTLASCSSRSAFCAVRRLTRTSTWSTSSDVAGAAAAGMPVMASPVSQSRGLVFGLKGRRCYFAAVRPVQHKLRYASVVKGARHSCQIFRQNIPAGSCELARGVLADVALFATSFSRVSGKPRCKTAFGKGRQAGPVRCD